MWPWRKARDVSGKVDTLLRRDANTFELLNDTIIRLRVTAQDLERVTKELIEDYERAQE